MNTSTLKQLVFAGLVAVGCAGTALDVQAAGQETRGQQSEQPGSDTWITTKVKAELLSTDNVSGMDIKVETVNGVVSLTGVVETQAEADRATAAARGIEGVTKVDNSALVVRPRK